jgi:DNA-binding protein HU-beta
MSKQTLGKSELISAVAAKNPDLSKKAVGEVVDSLLSTISEELAQGNEISITGFGKFSTVARAARNGRNPQTGAVVQIPASVAPKFSPGKALKDAIASK